MRSSIPMTFGVELEWPDVDVHQALPPGWTWSNTDYSVVNSNGIANDPKRKIMPWGGELNSPVYEKPIAMYDDVEALWPAMKPGYNYRSNLHIHVGLPQHARESTEVVLRIADYTRTYMPKLFPMFDPLEALYEGLHGAEHDAAVKRYQHSLKSRHHFVAEKFHVARYHAPNVDEILECEVAFARHDPHRFGLQPREALNLRALRKHGTFEFRCFAAPKDAGEVLAACLFAQRWMELALDRDPDPLESLWTLVRRTPRQVQFDWELEKGWQETNLQNHRRGEIQQLLRLRGVI